MKKSPTKKKASARNPAPKRTKTTSAPRKRGTAATKALATYRDKRDFRKTPEPEGKGPSRWKNGKNPIFVIQKHAASHLHYDFRLEIDGVLKSWAVPKGPPIDPAEKRLAVETEDHPLDYADFEGVIPEDEYGGGTVIVWDAGPFRNLKRDQRGKQLALHDCYETGQIEIWLEGKKLRGGYALIHSKLGGNPRNWLLVKMKDRPADVRRRAFGDADASVISGRTLEQVAQERSDAAD